MSLKLFLNDGSYNYCPNCGKIMKQENKIRKKYKCRKVKKMKKFLEIITGGIVGISIMFLLYIAPTL